MSLNPALLNSLLDKAHEKQYPTPPHIVDLLAPTPQMQAHFNLGTINTAPPAKSNPKPAESVNSPPHYKSHPSGIECIQITEHFNFNVGNAIKYLFRHEHKGKPLEDLKKARWYIDREIQLRERTPSAT